MLLRFYLLFVLQSFEQSEKGVETTRRTFTAYTLVGVFSFALCLADAHAQYTISGSLPAMGHTMGLPAPLCCHL